MKSPNPYSYGIRTGDTLFLSGLVSRNGKDNSVVEGDMTAQTKTVLDNAAQILKAAGMSFDNVVSSRVFITDQTKFQEMNKTYQTFFTEGSAGTRDGGRAADGPAVSGRDHVDGAAGCPSRCSPRRPPTARRASRAPILSSAVKVGKSPVCVRHPRQHA